MNPNPLANLKDIHLPSPIGWWPLAPGWYLVAFAVLSVCLLLLRYFSVRAIKQRPQRLACKRLTEIKQALAEDPHQAVIAISALLRRLALAKFPRREVAHLQGDAWLAFLNATGKTTAFSNPPGNLLATAPYQSRLIESVDLAGLLLIARRWIINVKR
jgi:hypothetical protein